MHAWRSHASKAILAGLVIGAAAWTATAETATPAPDAAAAKKLYLSRSCIACHGKEGRKAIQDYPELAGQDASYLAQQVHDILDGKRVGSNDASGNPRSNGMRGALIAPDGSKRVSDDDIAAITAWLAALPAADLPADQPALDADKTAAAQKLFTQKCQSCHGKDGTKPLKGYPVIAGQKRAYILAQVKDIRDKARANGRTGMMAPFVAKLADADIELLADYISRVPPVAK